MKYVPPIGGAANDPYVDANIALGIEGSPVPAAAIEDVMREVVAVITAGGLVPDENNLTQLLQALRSSGVFTTPAQFDNTTKAATTEYVQRALGSFSKQTNYAASTVLTASDVGSVIGFANGASACTLTLPPASAAPIGACISFFGNLQTGTKTVAAAAGDTITLPDSATTGSVTIPSVGTAMFRRNLGGGGWSLHDGTEILKFSSVFGASLAANGYQKLPGGLIIQWGVTGTLTGSGQTANITLPVAMPNTVLQAVTTLLGNAANPSEHLSSTKCGNFSTTGFSIYTGNIDTPSVAVRWIAIGY